MKKSVAVMAALLLSPVAIAQQDSPPPPQGGMPSPDQIFAFLDANKDGFIAKDEAKGPLSQHFDRVDADKDGKISPEELKTAMAAMRPPEPAEGEPQQ